MNILRIRLFTLIFIFFCSTSFVIALYFGSDRINKSRNHFIRIFAPHVQKEMKSYDIGNKNWYVSGFSINSLSLNHRHYLNALLTVNLKSYDTTMSIISIPHFSLKNPKIHIWKDNLYVLDGDQPAIYIASINDVKHSGLVNNKYYFDMALPTDENSFVVRFLNRRNEFTLGRLDSNKLIEAPKLLQGKGDGIMSKDGILLTDNINRKIVYLSYYRNEYLVADQNMKLLYRGKTKDTVNVSKIKVGKPDKNGNVVMASPPIVTNKLAALYNNYLFVNSALLADNENRTFFNGSSVIDVYDIREGLYKFSFYIPDHKNKKIREFNVFGDKLVAMFEDQCIIYELARKYFK